MLHFIIPQCPGLAALLSLASVVTKQRQSVFTIRPIHSPALPILQHVLFKFVNLASTVLEHFQLPPLIKISLFILNLPRHRTCQEAITSEQCALNRNVSSSQCHDILELWSSHGLIFFYCRCYGENFTEHLLYTYYCTNTISNVCTRVCCYHGNSIIFLTTPTSLLNSRHWSRKC